jgi:predicted RND superfamily exporter protein
MMLTLYSYRFFRRRKALFFVLLTVSFVFFAYFAVKVGFEEDISRLLPEVSDKGTERFAFADLKVKDKVFILFAGKNGEVAPDDLVEACDEFTGRLLEAEGAETLVGGIFSRIGEEVLSDAVRFLYDNAPVFLDETMYPKIDSLLETSNVERRMDENYALLTSSAGAAFGELVTRDPAGLRDIFVSNGFSGAGLGGNYRLYAEHVFTPDTTVAVAFLSPNFKSLDSRLATRLVELIESESERFTDEHPEIEILFHGAPVQSVSNATRIKKDLLLTVAGSLVLIFVLLMFCFRNGSTVVFMLFPVIYGTVFALAMMYFVKGTLSIMALGIGAVVLGVAFSYCLHVICHYKYVGNPEQVLRDQTIPVTLGSLTTIGAFSGLLLTDSELLRDFGLFASFALAGSTAFALFALPLLFRSTDTKKTARAFALVERINNYPFDRNKPLLILIVAVSAVCCFASGRVKFDPNLRNIGYSNPALLRSTELLASKTADNRATFYFASPSADLDSALLENRRLSAELDRLVAQGDIAGYSSPASLIVPEGEQRRRIELWNSYWTAERRATARQAIETVATRRGFEKHTFDPFFAMTEADYEPVSMIDAEVLPQELLDNMVERSDNRWLTFTSVFMDKDRLWSTGAKLKGKADFVVLDPMYYASEMVKTVHDDFNTALVVSSAFVLLVLLFSFGNLLVALLAFLPMALSWYIVLGVMAIFGLEFNLINIIISNFVFGVGVDYSIFVTDGLLSQYRTRSSLLAHHKSAIFFSAVVLITVIVSLLFAVHPALKSVGVATLTGMTATILISYSLQPYLFRLLISGRAAKGKPPVAFRSLFRRANRMENRLKNVYLCKGFSVESALRRELKATGNYALLIEAAKGKNSMLDYGCGFGFATYGVALTFDGIEITGFDSDANALALARNCFAKTERIHFTGKLTSAVFDLVTINKPADDETLRRLSASAGNRLIVRRSSGYRPEGFEKYEADGIYDYYKVVIKLL